MDNISKALKAVIGDEFGINELPDISRPEEKFGDYTTNVSLKLAAKLGKNPIEIANRIADKLRTSNTGIVSEVNIAGPGFINIRLKDTYLLKMAANAAGKQQTFKDQVIVTEYSDPNPFKVLHAGHIYTSVVGDAVANLFESCGGKVHRVNFGGDVGLHVGKTMWAILTEESPGDPDEDKAWAKIQSMANDPLRDRAQWMANCYMMGNNAYEQDAAIRESVKAINKHAYELHDSNDHESVFGKIYWTCRTWSYDYFDEFYAYIGSHFEKYYPESVTAPLGLKTVKEELQKGVYEKSDGAVIFNGEKYGLHTRVFINSQGLPTYEAKDVGLIMAKWNDYHFDKSVVITGNDIVEYMKVVLKSIEQFEPQLAERSVHLTHGQVKLAGGVKMSSRKGNVLLAEDILKEAESEAQKLGSGEETKDVSLAAVKYSFLKQRIGADIIYNPEESVSLEGNSGPYLQYAHARACSILSKTPNFNPQDIETNLEKSERSLVLKLSEYPEVITKSVNEMLPHHICTYLYELAQGFNRFYEQNRVIGSDRQSIRLQLVFNYKSVLKDGLSILGINAPERM